MTAYASTRATIRTAVLDKLRLSSTDDTAKVNIWIDQVNAQVAQETRYLSGSATGAALAAGASSQALPSTLVHLEFLTCTYGGNVVLLKEKTFGQILELRQGASATQGPPVAYALRKTTVEFWGQAQGSEVLTYYGAVLPDTMADGDSPAYPEPFGAKLLEYGTLVQGAEFKKDLLMLGDFQQLFDLWLQRFQTYLNRRQGLYPRAFETWTGEPGVVPHDPSADVASWRR